MPAPGKPPQPLRNRQLSLQESEFLSLGHLRLPLSSLYTGQELCPPALGAPGRPLSLPSSREAGGTRQPTGTYRRTSSLGTTQLHVGMLPSCGQQGTELKLPLTGFQKNDPISKYFMASPGQTTLATSCAVDLQHRR